VFAQGARHGVCSTGDDFRFNNIVIVGARFIYAPDQIEAIYKL